MMIRRGSPCHRTVSRRTLAVGPSERYSQSFGDSFAPSRDRTDLTRTWQALRHWLLDTRPARQAFEVLLRALGGRRLARLDEEDAARRQTCLLLGYLHQA